MSKCAALDAAIVAAVTEKPGLSARELPRRADVHHAAASITTTRPSISVAITVGVRVHALIRRGTLAGDGKGNLSLAQGGAA
jgi:hypothetical protein